MVYTPQIFWSEFITLVKKEFDNEESESNYKQDVASAASRARSQFFPDETVDSMGPHWTKWIGEIPEGAVVPHKDWEKVQKFNENTIGDLRKGNAAAIHAFAAHYRLHMYHLDEDLKLADWLDKRVFGQPLRRQGKPVFRYEPDSFRDVDPNPLFPFPDYKLRRTVEEHLETNKHHGIWLDPHNHYSIPLEGRQDEKDRLTAFMGSNQKLRIMPVVGPSGAGKTRLISEWMKPYVKLVEDTDWDAGFVVSDQKGARDPTRWENWTVENNSLIVIDYTHAFDEVFHQIVHQARHQNPNDRRVRLILIDHVMPDALLGDLVSGGEGFRESALESFKQNYVEKPLVLEQETADSDLLKHVIAVSASLWDKEYDTDDEIIGDALTQLDRIGREQGDIDAVRHPLFAALMGQVIREAEGGEVDFTALSRRDLITYYFQSHDRLPWTGWSGSEKAEEKTRHGLTVGALVSTATLRRGLHVFDAQPSLPEDHARIVGDANKIVSYEGGDQHLKIKPFLPDIVGEAFLLKFLHAVKSRDEDYKRFIAILQASQDAEADETAQNFRETIARLARNLANDDPKEAEVIESWQALCAFLDPKRFASNTFLRATVSHAISEVMQQVVGVSHQLDASQQETALDVVDPSTGTSHALIRQLESIVAVLEDQFSIEDIEEVTDNEKLMVVAETMFRFFEFTRVGSEENYRASLERVVERFGSNHQNKLTAIMSASYDGRLRVARYLMEVLGNQSIGRATAQGVTALMLASQNGHLPVVDYLHKKGADINTTMDDGWTPLMSASQNGHLPVAEYLCGKGADVHAATQDGRTALMSASQNGHLPVVKYLHKKGADIHTMTDDGWTALMLASVDGYLPVVEYLHVKGADVHAAKQGGWTALMLASQNGHLPVVEHLHGKGADVHATTQDGATALIIASQNGHLPVVEHLHGKGADVHATTQDGVTALIVASQNGHLPVVEHLHVKGADVNAAMQDDGATALMIASQNGHLPVVEYLLNKGADMHAAKQDGMTAMMLASANGHLPVAGYLHGKGADVHAIRLDGATALMLASANGHLPVAGYLHGKGADVHAMRLDGATALMLASKNGHLPVVEYLYGKGADVHAATQDGWTALMLASVNGYLPVVEYLHVKGADVHVAKQGGWTALMLASQNGHLPVVEHLHGKGADVHATTQDGATALIVASQNGHLPVVEHLHGKGADVNAKRQDGMTAMMLASANGHLPVVEYLHVKGADVNAAMQDDGWTALMLASANDHLLAVEYLHRKGADVNAAKRDGWTALMLASQNGNLDVVKHLADNGAEILYTNKEGRTAIGLAHFNHQLEVHDFLVGKCGALSLLVSFFVSSIKTRLRSRGQRPTQIWRPEFIDQNNHMLSMHDEEKRIKLR